jgi:hypothetical protein
MNVVVEDERRRHSTCPTQNSLRGAIEMYEDDSEDVRDAKVSNAILATLVN